MRLSKRHLALSGLNSALQDPAGCYPLALGPHEFLFCVKKTWGLAGLSPSWRVYPSWCNRTLRCFCWRGRRFWQHVWNFPGELYSELFEKIMRYILCVILICFIISSYILLLEETSTKANTIWYFMIMFIYFTQCIYNVQSTPDHDLGSVINLYVYLDIHFTMYLFCFTK